MSFRERMEEEDRNQRFEDERRAEREREHAPAWPDPTDVPLLRPEPPDRLRLEQFDKPPSIGPDPTLLMVVQVPDDVTIGEVVQAVGRQAVNHGVTLMLWTGRPRRRQRRAMKLLFGRKLGKRLTG